MGRVNETQRRVDARARAMAAQIERVFSRWADAVAREEAARVARGRVVKAEEDERYVVELMRIFDAYGIRQLEDAARDAARSVGSDWISTPGALDRFLAEKEIKIQNLAQSTREMVVEHVRRIIEETRAMAPQPPTSAIATRIRREITHGGTYAFSSERAAMIARTELAQAENTGIFTGYEAAGVQEIEWLAFSDGKSGDRHHERMDGRKVRLGDFFVTPLGSRMLYPGDPSAPIKETAGCRCTVRAVTRRAA